MVVPDQIIITLGVETWNKQLTAAKTENDQRTEKIINVAKKHGIDPKHIQTNHLNIEPRYEYSAKNSRVFIDYFVKKSLYWI